MRESLLDIIRAPKGQVDNLQLLMKFSGKKTALGQNSEASQQRES